MQQMLFALNKGLFGRDFIHPIAYDTLQHGTKNSQKLWNLPAARFEPKALGFRSAALPSVGLFFILNLTLHWFSITVRGSGCNQSCFNYLPMSGGIL